MFLELPNESIEDGFDQLNVLLGNSNRYDAYAHDFEPIAHLHRELPESIVSLIDRTGWGGYDIVRS